MSNMTHDDLRAIVQLMQAQQPAAATAPAPPTGAITTNSIVKYQTIIIFFVMSIVGVGGWLVSNSVAATTELLTIKNDVATHGRAIESLNAARTDQARTAGEVRELQIAVSAITTGQKEIANDLRAVGQQVAAISQSLRAPAR